MNKRYLVAGLLIIGIAAALVNGIRVQKKTVKKTQAVQTLNQRSRGPERAPIQIVEFSDYECGACKKAETALEELHQAYPGKIRVIFKHYPLPSHPWSKLAHAAAECAALSGKFWEYHGLLYAHQEIWTKTFNPLDPLMRYAVQAGLNVDSFSACLTSPETQERIAADQHEGELQKIHATPTFFLNGTRLVGPLELKERGKRLIDSILASIASSSKTRKPS